MSSDLIRINAPSIGEEEIQAVTEVLRSGILTDKSGMGPRVSEFERTFAKEVDAKYAVAVSSGTAALHASLLAADVGRDDEVILPSFTYVATAEAVLLAGAKPIFAEIDEDTYCISVEGIEDCLSHKTRAIIPVDLYGHPADLDPINEIAHSRDIAVIEDAAQANSAAYKGKKVGSISNLTCYSFYASKNMTTGEGGMITTNDDDLSQTLRMIRSHGEERPYWVTRLGNNYRMTEIEAAIGLVQLQKLAQLQEAREKNAHTLTEELQDLKALQLPQPSDEIKHAWHLYTIRLKGANAGKRNKVLNKLRSKRISSTIYYETPIHLLPYYRNLLGSRKNTLPKTEKAARQVFSLPIHPRLTPEDLEYITKHLEKIVG